MGPWPIAPCWIGSRQQILKSRTTRRVGAAVIVGMLSFALAACPSSDDQDTEENESPENESPENQNESPEA